MKLTHHDGIFVLETTYAEAPAARAANFRWHKADCTRCAACVAGVPHRVWWTRKASDAATLAGFADDATRATLTAALGVAHALDVAAIHASSAQSSVTDFPAPAGSAYLPYQKAGIAYLLGRANTLLADEQGLGKTVQVLGMVNADPTIANVLIVCPASLRLNWQREAARWLVRPATIVLPTTVAALPERAADGRIVVTVVSYDTMRQKPMHAALMARSFDLLAADEAHYCKNTTSLRAKALLGNKRGTKVAGLVSRAARAVFMTGTPIPAKPIEIQPLLAACDSVAFGSFWKFAQKYCGATHNGYGWDFTGAANLADLQARMRATCMVRRLKADVLLDLPAKIRQVISLPLPSRIATDADPRFAEIASAWEATARLSPEARATVLESVNKTKLLEYFTATRVAVAKLKAPYAIEHVRGMLEYGVGKVVVFGWHRATVDGLADAFGAEAVRLHGGMTDADKQASVDRFQTDPTCRVFVGNIQAAGVGLTLTAASHVVFVEMDWTPGNMVQAEDRCHRLGQHACVSVQYLVFDGTLDEHLADVLARKTAVAFGALDAAVVLPTHVTLPDVAPVEAPAPAASVAPATALTSESVVLDFPAASADTPARREMLRLMEL
jgi:SWI/SNF-related matrix-associated actin-dependent regulator 1 of chromatin subfamily A